MSPWKGWGNGYEHHGKGGHGPSQSMAQELAALKKVVYGDANHQEKGKGGGYGKGQNAPKGKGKSSEKGKGGKGKGKGEGWWPCPTPGCKTKLNAGVVFLNHPDRDACMLCYAPKGAAVSVAADARTKVLAEVRAEVAAAAPAPPAVDADGFSMSKRQQRKKRAAEKKEAGAAVQEVADSDMEADMEEGEEPLPTEKEIEGACKALSRPQPLKEGWSAAALVDDETLQESSQSLATLRKEQASCAKILKLLEDGTLAGVDGAVTKARHTALEKAILKATKEAPTVAVCAAQLKLDKVVYLRERDEKLLFVAKGTANAKESFDKARAMHRRMVEHWQERLDSLDSEEIERQELFTERNKVHEQRHVQVLEEFDKRIQAAVTVAEEAAKAAGGNVQILNAPAPQTLLSDEEKKEAAKKEEDAKKLQEEADKEEKEKKEEASKELAVAKEAFRRLHVTAAVTKEDLPNLDGKGKASKEHMPVLALMYHWARASVMGDTMLPYTFFDMGATVEVAIMLVGEKAWKSMFKGETMAASMVCPMQMRQLMFAQLMAYDGALRAEPQTEKQEEVALKSLAGAEPRLKKLKAALRQGPY